ncbi:MAG: sugar phosphate isomerase/epimerase [Acidobacteria bacterium]|nr:sugar phosphate isomerase/epimerase [Acidobacteriota bacterium]MBI3657167.1 sugar phosphate isomerase/epimerase [Acidobacteriota bacterium]
MVKLTRREWSKMTAGGLIAAWSPHSFSMNANKPKSRVNGVLLGAQSYSFRDRALDDVIHAMAEIGLSSCELWQGHVEPAEFRKRAGDAKARAELRVWRLKVPLSEFKAVRAKFESAGIDIHAYNLSFRDDFTDAEIERGFEMTQALGARIITASANVSTAKRIDPYALRYKIHVGMHNHSIVRPNEFAAPNSFVEAMKGASDYIAINLDIGHFTAANFDAVDFLRRHHARIVSLHIKDRKRNQGELTPFGQGDAPIRPVLQLLRENRWPIPANIEYEYAGLDTIAEVKRCLAYCKQALEA